MTARLRIGGYQDERSVHTRAVRVLIEAMRQHIGASVVIDFEPDIAARGCKVADLLSLVERGDLDLCYFSSSYLSARVPALGVLDIPFAFADRADTQRRLCGPLGAHLKREIATHSGFVALAFWDNGLRNISNRRRPIRAPADCAGLTIRTLPNARYHAAFRAFGMTPVTIDVAEMMRAIASGKVDAQENPLSNIHLFGIGQYHPFVTMSGHFHGIAVLLGSARTLAAWPEPARRALDQAAAAASSAQWQLAAEEDTSSRAALAAAGVNIIDLDDAARGSFREAARMVIEDARRALPRETAAILRNGLDSN